MPRKPPASTTPRRPRTKRATRTPAKGKKSPAMRKAKFALGQVVRHRVYAFRGVVFDIDPVFNNTEDWWQSIPAEIRPVKDQPYYHLLADTSGEPLRHPQLGEYFVEDEDGRYRAVFQPH